MDKPKVIYTCKATLFIHKKEGSTEEYYYTMNFCTTLYGYLTITFF